MIELKQVSAGYADRPVLQRISLSFCPGEVLAVAGPNGCGKSTLLKTALGLIPYRSGSIFYDGRSIEQLSSKERARKAAFLTQSRATPQISAGRLVLHGRFPWVDFPGRYTQKDRELAREAMEKTKSLPFASRQLSRLSGGQRQSVYLAMMLAQGADTLFLDEPTTWLDIRNQLHLLSMARQWAQQGKAVVIVLHDISLALRWADRMAVLCEGRLEAWDRPEAVFGSGVLDTVMGVKVKRFQTDSGWHYYCDESS